MGQYLVCLESSDISNVCADLQVHCTQTARLTPAQANLTAKACPCQHMAKQPLPACAGTGLPVSAEPGPHDPRAAHARADRPGHLPGAGSQLVQHIQCCMPAGQLLQASLRGQHPGAAISAPTLHAGTEERHCSRLTSAARRGRQAGAGGSGVRDILQLRGARRAGRVAGDFSTGPGGGQPQRPRPRPGAAVHMLGRIFGCTHNCIMPGDMGPRCRPGWRPSGHLPRLTTCMAASRVLCGMVVNSSVL